MEPKRKTKKTWGILYIPLGCLLFKVPTPRDHRPNSYDVYLGEEFINKFKDDGTPVESSEYGVLSLYRVSKPNLKQWIKRIDDTLASYCSIRVFEMLEMDINHDYTFSWAEFEVVEIGNEET